MERLSKFRRMRVDTTVVETNTAACWATRCGCSPAPTDSLEPIPSVDAEKRGDRKGEPDERQYDHCDSNDKRPEQIFPRSLRRRVDRVELPVCSSSLLIMSSIAFPLVRLPDDVFTPSQPVWSYCGSPQIRPAMTSR